MGAEACDGFDDTVTRAELIRAVARVQRAPDMSIALYEMIGSLPWACSSASTARLGEAEDLLLTWHLGAGCDPLNGMVDADTVAFLAGAVVNVPTPKTTSPTVEIAGWGADDSDEDSDAPPMCEDCGGESGAPSSACPMCRKVVCQNCAEREGAFCCGEAKGE